MAKAARSPEREPDPDFSEETDQIVDRPQAEHVDPPVDDGAEQQRVTERRARAQGWVPQDQYRGDSAKWVDAETFLEKGYGNNDILRERIDRLADKLSERDGQLGEMGQVLAQLNEKTTLLHQRAVVADRDGYTRGKAEAEARMRKAVEDANPEAYDEAKADLDAIEAKPIPAAVDTRQPARTQQPAARPQVDPVTAQWVKENESWWKDPELSDATIVIHRRLSRENPNLGQIEGFNMAKAEMMRRYPEKFENPRRTTPGGGGARTPSGDRGGNGNGTGRRSVNNLPPEAKAACEMFKRTIPSVKDKETGKWRKYTDQDFLDTYDGEWLR